MVNGDAHHVAHIECLAKLLHRHSCLIHDVLGGPTREKSGEFVVKCDELLGDLFPLKLVRREDLTM